MAAVFDGVAGRGSGDYDGDGRADILWRNSNTGVNVIWRSANSATTQAVARKDVYFWSIVGFKE